jgi:hypothetical protein
VKEQKAENYSCGKNGEAEGADASPDSVRHGVLLLAMMLVMGGCEFPFFRDYLTVAVTVLSHF